MVGMVLTILMAVLATISSVTVEKWTFLELRDLTSSSANFGTNPEP
jgi:hypothetical protein